MSSFIVSSAAALNTALSHAQAGDTVELAPGTYSDLTINGDRFSGAVTITSLDPTNQAVITELNLAYDQGLVFQNLEFSLPMGDGTSVPHGIFVNHSQDIHFRSDSIHGLLGVAPTNDQTGIGIANSSNVSVENSELQYLYDGITMGSDNTVLISGNNFHDIRIDGIAASSTQNATITNNNFSNFHHLGVVGAGGDHSDAIQFWTTGQTVGSANLTITNNIIVQGQGRDMQGIFLQDSVGNLPYKNVQVTSNLIIGGNWNGIMVDDAHGALIGNNNVVPLSTQSQIPWIKVQNSDQVYMNHNAAGSFCVLTSTNLTENGDKINAAAKDQGVGAITVYLNGHPNHIVPMGPVTAHDLVWDVEPGAAAAAIGLLGLGAVDPSLQ
jgi:nitrous oxidase accessory protein NosD